MKVEIFFGFLRVEFKSKVWQKHKSKIDNIAQKPKTKNLNLKIETQTATSDLSKLHDM